MSAAVGAKVDDLGRLLQLKEKALMFTALDRCEIAFSYTSGERERVWREEERHLHAAVNLAFLELFGDELEALVDKSHQFRGRLWEHPERDAEDIARTLAWPLLCVQARVEVLLLLNQPKAAQGFAQRIEQWLTKLDVDPLAYIKARRGAAPIGADHLPLVIDEARRLQDFAVRRAASQAANQATFCGALIEKQLDFAQAHRGGARL